jgi:hypothetical protein
VVRVRARSGARSGQARSGSGQVSQGQARPGQYQGSRSGPGVMRPAQATVRVRPGNSTKQAQGQPGQLSNRSGRTFSWSSVTGQAVPGHKTARPGQPIETGQAQVRARVRPGPGSGVRPSHRSQRLSLPSRTRPRPATKIAVPGKLGQGSGRKQSGQARSGPGQGR